MDNLKHFDLFGTTCKFYIKGQRKYWTRYGGILSIISVLLFILLFFFLNYEDFIREIPQTSTSSIPEVNFRKIKFDEEKIDKKMVLCHLLRKNYHIDYVMRHQ